MNKLSKTQEERFEKTFKDQIKWSVLNDGKVIKKTKQFIADELARERERLFNEMEKYADKIKLQHGYDALMIKLALKEIVKMFREEL